MLLRKHEGYPGAPPATVENGKNVDPRMWVGLVCREYLEILADTRLATGLLNLHRQKAKRFTEVQVLAKRQTSFRASGCAISSSCYKELHRL